MRNKKIAQEYKDTAKIFVKLANICEEIAEIYEDEKMSKEEREERSEHLIAEFIVQINKINKL